MALLFLTCPSLPSQTPLQESLIELSDSSLNKMATDMFLGVGVGLWPGPWVRGVRHCVTLLIPLLWPSVFPSPQLIPGAPLREEEPPAASGHSPPQGQTQPWGALG